MCFVFGCITAYVHLSLRLSFRLKDSFPPLCLMWVPNVVKEPAEKRAVSIAFVNAMGNVASIYGVFLWPSTDAPRYIPGFSATTVQVACIAVLAQVMAYLFKRYPDSSPSRS
jgi:hypothetical protein